MSAAAAEWAAARAAAIDEAVRAGAISLATATVARALNDLANAEGVLRGISYADLAACLGRTTRTIGEHVRRLVKAGVVDPIQRGRGWRRAAYAVAPNSRPTDPGPLRAVPRCGSSLPHPDQKRVLTPEQVARRTPLLRAPASCSRFALNPHFPERVLATLEARGSLPDPDIFDRARLRSIVHGVCANARRLGRWSSGGLLRNVLSRAPLGILPRWIAEQDAREAARTLAEADRREVGLARARVLASEASRRPASPPEPAGKGGPPGALLDPAERAALEDLNADLIARRYAGLEPPCTDLSTS